jgi:hypothetical protein
MTATKALLPWAVQQFLDDNGDPLALGKVYTYEAGGTTPLTTYDSSGSAHTNPIVLDAGGRTAIWITKSALKIVVCDADDVPVRTEDNILVSGVLPADSAIPTAPVGLTVVADNGRFVAEWETPVSGGNTLDDVAIQYATDSGFSTGVVTTAGWNFILHREGSDPNKIYYFRVAFHNKSGATSNATTALAIANAGYSGSATGWGPFCTAVGPVSSYPDAAIPSAPLSPAVTAVDSRFVADWSDPASYGNDLTDVCIQAATNNVFTTGVELSIGWGRCNHQESTYPGKTLYFRFAWRNSSQQASNATTKAAILAAGYAAADYNLGWGPFTAAVGPVTTAASAAVDAVIPGVPTDVAVNANGAEFVATWGNPTTGYNTLCDVCIQYDTVNTFDSANLVTAAGWGKINSQRGYDPNKTYYFRFAWRNLSGAASNATVDAAIDATGHTEWLHATGWGPFCAAAGPVSTGFLNVPVQGAGSNPTTSDIPAGNTAIWNDATGYHWWVNDSGTMRQL